MRLKKTSMREVKDAALTDRIVIEPTAPTARAPKFTPKPGTYYRGALIKPK